MTKTELKQAIRLYRAYQTTSPQYKALAVQVGYDHFSQLNQAIWHILNRAH